MASSGDLPLDEALAYIDIGGVAMLRAAAKNFTDVTVVCLPQQYEDVLTDLEQNDGATSLALRQRLALETFQHTAAYDGAISAHLHAASSAESEASRFARRETLVLNRERALRYGENPHQGGGTVRLGSGCASEPDSKPVNCTARNCPSTLPRRRLPAHLAG